MIYVFDTGSFIVLKHYYPATFPKLWKGLDDLVASGNLVSVSDALRELEAGTEEDALTRWLKTNKALFQRPSLDDQRAVAQILAVKSFQQLIGQKALLKGSPVADPFVIAAAMTRRGTVVTEERKKPNATKIPNVCEYFKVPCLDLKGFFESQGWTF